MEKTQISPGLTEEPKVQGHCPFRIVVIITTVVVFLVSLIFQIPNVGKGVFFDYDQTEISAFFYFEITPAGWAFSTWGLIYLMQTGFLIYAVASLFRKTSRGPLYVCPGAIPFPVFILYCVIFSVGVGWLFSFDKKLVLLAMFFLIAVPLNLIACMVIGLRQMPLRIVFFQTEGQRYELILLNIFVYNAWAIYLGWTICAALLNVGMVFIYSIGVEQQTAGLISLTVLLVLLLVAFPLEITILDKYLRYVVMHYFGPLMALAGSVVQAGANDKGIVPSGVNRTYAAVILGILLLCIVIKVLNLGIRCWKQPLYYNRCSNNTNAQDDKNNVDV